MASEQLPFSSHSPDNNPDQYHPSLRHHRLQKYNSNPILSSPQYQAYRSRQREDDKHNRKEQKWPDILEFAFLNALVDIPPMGRKKYFYDGKPHGRNEIISQYLRIAYHQSLRPGERPDATMVRDRKQVSSHIQVLKGFMKDHPASRYLLDRDPENLSDDTFDNDPCLRALAQGRLPPWRYDITISPSMFWLIVTSAKVQDGCCDLYEDGAVTHRYSRLSSQAPSAGVDSIPDWSQRFPYLEAYYNAADLDCEIIHMDVALNLMGKHAQDGSDLVTRSEVSITIHGNENCEWQTFTSLIKPQQLCQDYGIDQHSAVTVTPAKILFTSTDEIRLKVRFPAEEWARLFTCLTEVQLKCQDSESFQALEDEPCMKAERLIQEYLRQVSMYQEIQSCSGVGTDPARRAIILWTFRAVSLGERAETTWRSLKIGSLESCVSPTSSETSTHLSSGATNELSLNANSPRPLYGGVSDLSAHGCKTDLYPALVTEDYGHRDGGQQFYTTPNNFSLESLPLDGSELSFVTDSATENIGAYISNAANTRISGFGQASLVWDGLPSSSFHPGSSWTNYAATQSNVLHSENEPMAMGMSWHVDMDPRLSQWTEMGSSRQQPLYSEQNNDNLLSWINPVDEGASNVYIENDVIPLPVFPPGPTDTKDPGWMDSD